MVSRGCIKHTAKSLRHDYDVIMDTMASQITSLTIVYSTVHAGADQRKHQSSASLAFVRGVHRWPVNSPHKWPVTRKMFPFDDVIMISGLSEYYICWSPKCSWCITCRRCSNYIFILDLTLGFNGLGKNNCKTRRETCQFLDLMLLTLKVLRYL